MLHCFYENPNSLVMPVKDAYNQFQFDHIQFDHIQFDHK